MQTKLSSLIESTVNLILGMLVGLLSQLAIFPVFNIDVPMSTNLWLVVWFTAMSFVRTYIIRRWFNAKIHAASLKLSGEKN